MWGCIRGLYGFEYQENTFCVTEKQIIPQFKRNIMWVYLEHKLDKCILSKNKTKQNKQTKKKTRLKTWNFVQANVGIQIYMQFSF